MPIRQGRDGARWLHVRARLVRTWRLDGAACWLCRQPIDWSLPRRHPLGGTADHLVPLSAGGDPNDPGNLVPAHMVCNSRRGNRSAVTVSSGQVSTRSRAW
ncbi:MAG: HNH endonuclease [Pseudonocardiaceae bacterium]